jgi:hypothetical protein
MDTLLIAGVEFPAGSAVLSDPGLPVVVVTVLAQEDFEPQTIVLLPENPTSQQHSPQGMKYVFAEGVTLEVSNEQSVIVTRNTPDGETVSQSLAVADRCRSMPFRFWKRRLTSIYPIRHSIWRS